MLHVVGGERSRVNVKDIDRCRGLIVLTTFCGHDVGVVGFRWEGGPRRCPVVIWRRWVQSRVRWSGETGQENEEDEEDEGKVEKATELGWPFGGEVSGATGGRGGKAHFDFQHF